MKAKNIPKFEVVGDIDVFLRSAATGVEDGVTGGCKRQEIPFG